MTRIERLFLIASGVVLVFLVIFLNKPPFYDEPAYLSNVLLINQFGWSKTYLLKHQGSAGPLYALIHYLLQPITKLQTPYIRLVNVLFLFGTIGILSRTFFKLSLAKELALLALAIPMTYVIGGLALTEMPAIFFLSLSIYLMLNSGETDGDPNVWKLIIAGLSFGLAIIGRQPFLLLLAALPLLFFKSKRMEKVIFPTIVVGFFALVIPAYIFFTWKGLVAPADASLYKEISKKGSDFRIDFFFLCLAYYTIVFAIIAPQIFKRLTHIQYYVAGLIFFLLIALNSFFKIIVFLPANFLLSKVLSNNLIYYSSLIFGAFIGLSSLYLLYSFHHQLRKRDYPRILLFYVISIMIIALSCAKITWGFSSRYPGQALPLLVPIAAYFYKRSRYNLIRIIVGASLGITSYLSYMHL